MTLRLELVFMRHRAESICLMQSRTVKVCGGMKVMAGHKLDIRHVAFQLRDSNKFYYFFSPDCYRSLSIYLSFFFLKTKRKRQKLPFGNKTAFNDCSSHAKSSFREKPLTSALVFLSRKLSSSNWIKAIWGDTIWLILFVTFVLPVTTRCTLLMTNNRQSFVYPAQKKDQISHKSPKWVKTDFYFTKNIKRFRNDLKDSLEWWIASFVYISFCAPHSTTLLNKLFSFPRDDRNNWITINWSPTGERISQIYHDFLWKMKKIIAESMSSSVINCLRL
jgi:hypothetical protein